MKKVKVILSFATILVLVLGILSGCGSSGKAEETTAAPAGETAAATEATEAPEATMEISIAMWDIGTGMADGKAEKDELFQKVLKDVNITIKPVNVTWDDWMDKINLWASSGQLPDLWAAVALGQPTIDNWVKGGVVKALPDDLSKYPQIQKIMSLADVKPAVAADGKYYFIPRLSGDAETQYPDTHAMMVRKDWMAKLGWTKDPANKDEFLQLMKDFTTKDPDGNGKNDTFGVTGANYTYAPLWPLHFFNLEAHTNRYWIKEDGKWIPSYVSKKMVDFVNYDREMWKAGVVDKDFASIKTEEAQDKFINGKCGAMIYGAWPHNLMPVQTAWNKVNTDKKFTDSVKLLTLPQAVDGKTYHIVNKSYWCETYINANVDDTKLDRILRLMDYAYSPEYLKSTVLGVEGKDYTMDGDKVVVTRPKDDAGNFKNVYEIYPANGALSCLGAFNSLSELTNPGFDPEIKAMSNEFFAKQAEYTPGNVNFGIEFIQTPAKSKYVITVEDEVVKIMIGKDDPTKMWNDYVKQEEGKGLTQMIEEVNAKAAELGIK